MQKVNFKKFPAADGIRGIAVLIVLIAHALVMFIPATRPYLSGTGKIGVWLFFVLSAFLLTNKFLKTGLNKNSLLEYVFGRTVRILPLFLMAASFYFFLGYYDFATLLKIVTFQEGFAHLWTIPVEFKFYFLLPLFILMLNKARKHFGITFLLIITLILIIISRYFYPESNIPGNSIETRWYISSFLVGIFTSYLLASFTLPSRKLGIPITFCTLGILFTIPSFSNMAINLIVLDNLPTSYMTLSLLWAAFIYLSIHDSGLASKILSSRIMRKIGSHSFSTYLFHWFILSELAKRYSDSFGWMFFSIIVSLIFGCVISNLIEKRIEKLRHKIQKNIINNSN
ncbi:MULTISPECIES: acyltransferase family protein [Pantoea]|uniref:acyltransferase family protein n=1 Tax=Pantoea TaxID=53335 RepID=UPI00257C7876|nr:MULTISPECIES: acyltransferase [Pantoea]